MNRLVLCLAQGLGAGRIPIMPGTFGSVVGLGWVTLLLLPADPILFLAGTAVGIGLSVWLCGLAEQILGQTDPSSVVLDEIVALPVCFAGWLGHSYWQYGHLPAPSQLWMGGNVWWTVGIFLAFRLFDILKPWPVRQSQRLAGGWGVTTDDVLAAAYVNALILPMHGFL